MTNQEIISVLAELHRITGFRVSLRDANYEIIAAYPAEISPFCKTVQGIKGEREKCIKCDRQACRMALEKKDTHIYKCRYGITEAVSPLYSFDKLTGFLMMGQVTVGEDDAKSAARLLGEKCGAEGAEKVASTLNTVDIGMVQDYVNIMTLCARYLTMSNAIPTLKPTVAEMAKRYILENIDKKLVIGDICDKLKCSKSTLLTAFKKQYGITVNYYITEVKLGVAARLLTDSDLNICEIAQETGFSDQSYFSKVFSAKYGVSPTNYRQSSAEMARINREESKHEDNTYV